MKKIAVLIICGALLVPVSSFADQDEMLECVALQRLIDRYSVRKPVKGQTYFHSSGYMGGDTALKYRQAALDNAVNVKFNEEQEKKEEVAREWFTGKYCRDFFSKLSQVRAVIERMIEKGEQIAPEDLYDFVGDVPEVAANRPNS